MIVLIMINNDNRIILFSLLIKVNQILINKFKLKIEIEINHQDKII
jgi:hypothetical protein